MSFSGSKLCTCPDRREARRGRGPWVILQRKQNASSYGAAYDWSHRSRYIRKVNPSAWSHVLCTACGAHFRTQAGYVDNLPDASTAVAETLRGKLSQGQRADVSNLPRQKRKPGPKPGRKKLARKPIAARARTRKATR